MEKLKINIVIAARSYPISVNNTQEEEGMRKAALSINKLIARFEENYAVNDKQDVLAMVALQFASKLEISQLKESETDQKALNKINVLTKLITEHLE